MVDEDAFRAEGLFLESFPFFFFFFYFGAFRFKFISGIWNIRCVTSNS